MSAYPVKFEGGPLHGQSRVVESLNMWFDVPMATEPPYHVLLEESSLVSHFHVAHYYLSFYDEYTAVYSLRSFGCPFERDATRVGKHERKAEEPDMWTGRHLTQSEWDGWDEGWDDES